MTKLALVVAFLALGAAAWLAFDRQGLLDELAVTRDAQQAADVRLGSFERDLARLGVVRTGEESISASAPGQAPGTSAAGGALGSGPGLVPTPRKPSSVEERIDNLEKQLAAAQAKHSGPPTEGEAPARHQISFGGAGFLTSLDQAEKELKLDASQKAGIERVIDDVTRELEALEALPNDEGKTLKALQEDFQPELSLGEEGMEKFHAHMADLAKFRASKVPGTNETYAQAERRLRKDGKARVRSFLNPEQAKSWDKSHTDMLFGGGGGGMSASFVSVESGPAIELVVPGPK